MNTNSNHRPRLRTWLQEGAVATIAHEFIQCSVIAEDVTRHARTLAMWREPSVLEGYDVGALAGHLARAIFTAQRHATKPASPQAPLTDAAHYFAVVLGDHDPVDSSLHRDIRDRGATEASDGPEDLARRMQTSRATLLAALSTDQVLARPIDIRRGLTMMVGEYLRTRLVELVVHIDDLATSVDLPETPPIPESSHQDTAGILAETAAIRVGGLTTVRSLARAERNPEPVRAL